MPAAPRLPGNREPDAALERAAEQRPLNTSFQRHQLAANPQLTSVWTRGLVWGFAHVTLGRDEATIRIVTTPDDGSGQPVLAHEHSFERRGSNP